MAEIGDGRCQDQVMIVTGGAQGIGRALSKGLAREGATVVVADINGPRAQKTAEEIEESAGKAMAITTDVSKVGDTEEMARKVLARFGRIDGLVNNAAMFQRPAVSTLPCEQISVEEWDRIMAVNLRGVFLCCRATVPQMKEQRRGKIVNISSGTVFKGVPEMSHYVASKAGVVGFTRALARELGEYSINVNSVAPGFTLSLEEADEATAQELQQYAEKNMQARCFKRFETPEDIVGTVVFLCSSESDFITGQTVVVDGGALMR